MTEAEQKFLFVKQKLMFKANAQDFLPPSKRYCLHGAIAFVDVISARSVVELQTNNLKRLEKQLEATKERFKVGEVTRTDVAQAEARVDRAKADKIKATGDLTSSNSTYDRVFGSKLENYKRQKK